MAYKQHFAKDRQFVKNQELSFLYIPHGLEIA